MKLSELQLPQPYPFYKNYIDTLEEVELIDMLKRQMNNFPKFIESIPEEKIHYRYEVEKWTVTEVLLHIIDSERVFQYRALRFSRGDMTDLPGFEQDDYVPFSNAINRSVDSLIEEYIAVRQSTISLFINLSEEDLKRKGTASGLPWSVGALGFAICGHQRHHRNILRERYL